MVNKQENIHFYCVKKAHTQYVMDMSSVLRKEPLGSLAFTKIGLDPHTAEKVGI